MDKEKALANSTEYRTPDYTEDFSNEWVALHAVYLRSTIETLCTARAALGGIPPTLVFIKNGMCDCKVMKAESRDQAETEIIAWGKRAKENDSDSVIAVFESLSRTVEKTDNIKGFEDIPFEERFETYLESMKTHVLIIYLFDCVNKKAAIFKQDVIDSVVGFALGKVGRFPIKNVLGNLVDIFFKGYNS